MNPSASTSYHNNASSGPSTSGQPNQQGTWTAEDQLYLDNLTATWGLGSQSTFTLTDSQPQVSNAGCDPQQQNPPPQWSTSHSTAGQQHDQQQREAIVSDDTAIDGFTEEFSQAFFNWFEMNASGSQAEFEVQPSNPGAVQYVDSHFDFSPVVQPDLVLQSSTSSVSISSSTGSSEPAGVFNMLAQPTRLPSSSSDSHDEHGLSYTSSQSDGQSGQANWIQQPHPCVWTGQEQSSDTRYMQVVDSSSIRQPRTQPPIAQQPTSLYPTTLPSTTQHPTKQQPISRCSTTQQSTAQYPTVQQSTTQHSTTQHSSTQPSTTQQTRTQHPQIANTYRIVQPEAPARLVPLYANRHSVPQDVESPMISPLTVPPGGTFLAQQADAMSRLSNNPQARPTIGRTRRRSAIYYRHGRTVADSLIEVFEDAPENSSGPDVGLRNRTTSCNSTLRAKKPLGDMTNRSHTVSGPATSRGRIRKQSAPVGNTSNALPERPVGLSHLAWANNGFEPCSTGGTKQQRDALNMRNRFIEVAHEGSHDVRSQSSACSQSRKSSA